MFNTQSIQEKNIEKSYYIAFLRKLHISIEIIIKNLTLGKIFVQDDIKFAIVKQSSMRRKHLADQSEI